MKTISREPQLVIDVNAPFSNDTFNSNGIFNSFLSLIEMTDTPFVYALTAPWGCGKSTFIRMCAAEFKNQGYPSFVINVWEDDHLLESRDAFIAHLFGILRNIRKLDSIKTKSNRFIKAAKEPLLKIVDIAGKLYFKNEDFSTFEFIKTLGISGESLKEVGPELTKSALEVLFSKQNRSDLYSELRTNLQKVVDLYIESANFSGEVRPLIIFIDELDRCLPKEIIFFLNNLKHVFELNNVIFVLAFDEEQLIQSVQSMYGSKISVYNYLEKFINHYFRLNYRDFYHQYFMKIIDEGAKKNFISSKTDTKSYNEIQDMKIRINNLIVGFRLSFREIVSLTNFTITYLNYFSVHCIQFLDFVLFCQLLSYSNPDKLRKYILMPLRKQSMNEEIIEMLEHMKHIDLKYFSDLILPWLFIFRLRSISASEAFIHSVEFAPGLDPSGLKKVYFDPETQFIFPELIKVMSALFGEKS